MRPGEGFGSSRSNQHAIEEELMNDVSFDTLTRHASRLSLGAAGLTGLAAQPTPVTADAEKRNANKKANKKAKQKCQSQVGPCVSSTASLCNGNPACLAKTELCCAFFGNCDLSAWLVCLKA
jgi:hypothetical protein